MITKLFCHESDIAIQVDTNRRFGVGLHEGIDLFCNDNGWYQAKNIEEVWDSGKWRIRPPEVTWLRTRETGLEVLVPRPVDLLRLRAQFSIYSTLYIITGNEVTGVRFESLMTDVNLNDVTIFITERDAYDWLYWSSN